MGKKGPEEEKKRGVGGGVKKARKKTKEGGGGKNGYTEKKDPVVSNLPPGHAWSAASHEK